MAFPSNPNNGDTYIRYGRTYEYDSTMSMWKVKKSGIQLEELSDVDVTTTAPAAGETLVWSGTKFVPDEINLLSVYQSELPLTGNVAGQMAYVTDTSRLYIYTGAGWFNVALVNTNPTITSGPDGSYSFANDGTPIVLTLEAQDPEELPIVWSYVVTSGALGSTATVHQEDNVFTITPSTDENDVGQFSITFTASDGVNLATAVSSFTLSFGTADQYYNANTLLVKTGSTAGLNNHTFVDESTNGFTVTRSGDVYQGSFSPYSPAGWSAYFDGSGDYLTVNGGNGILNGTGDYTIECWVQLNNNNAFNIIQQSAGSSGYVAKWAFAYYSGSLRVSGHSPSSTPLDWISASWSPTLHRWYHLAVTRESNVHRLWVDGVQLGSNSTVAAEIPSITSDAYIGVFKDFPVSAPNQLNGYMSSLRVVNGTALYTSEFTPSTEPLTAISGTSLLTCQYNRFIDNSINNSTILSLGHAKLLPFSPFLPSEQYDPTVHGGSAYFDGSGDYLTANITPVSNLGATTYTIEGWVWINSAGNRALIGAAGSKYYIQWNTGTFYIGDGATNMSTSWAAPLNRWVHIAVSRDSGGTTRAFIDGTLLLTSTTTLQTGSLSYLEIGRKGSTAYIMDGYISNLRYVAGTALYTSDFTPPTEPLTAVSGTVLLLNMNNAGIYDEVAKSNIRTFGDVTTSTTQTKYNDTSMYFDGSGDYLTVNHDALGTGDWTIEGWVYFNVISATYIFDFRSSNNTNPALLIQNNWAYVAGGSIRLSTGVTPSANTWYHFALAKNSGETTMYIDGSSIGAYTDSLNYLGNTAGTIGKWHGGAASLLNGYIEDFRITKGVARYTANFTPPTAPLGFSNEE